MAYQEIVTDGEVLQPFEVPLNDAAHILAASIHECQEGITAVKIRAALVLAIRQGEIKSNRGTLNSYAWPVPEPILDLRAVKEWALANGLRLFTGGAGAVDEYLDHESDIEDDLAWSRIDRLRALRAIYAAGIDPFESEDPPASAADRKDEPSSANVRAELAKALTEVERMKRELAAERENPDPRHRSTLLRTIAALLQMARIDDTMPPKTAAHAINSRLKDMGQKEMKADTISTVITDARQKANDLME